MSNFIDVIKNGKYKNDILKRKRLAMEYLMNFINIVLIVLVMKYSKFKKIKNLLEKLFLIDKFNGEDFRSKILWAFGICIYMFMVISCIFTWLITFDSWNLYGAFLYGIVLPLGFRLSVYEWL